MKISLVNEKFKQGLGIVERVVNNRSALPILNNVLIKTNEGEVLLESTDLELAISYKLGGKIEIDGGVTVPARLLSSFVNSLTAEVVELGVENNVIKIQSGKIKTKINGIDPDEFPVIPKIEGVEVLDVNPKILADALNDVHFAVSGDESRMVLTGVCFDIQEGEVVLVGTDSYRLAERKIKVGEGIKVMKTAKFILPGRTAREIGKLMAGESRVKIFASETQVAFVSENIKVISRLIDGQYPDYEKIMPGVFAGKVKVSAKELAGDIAGALVFAKDGSNTLKLEFGEQLRLSATSQDVGEFQTELDITGDKPTIILTLNGRFLVDGLNVLGANGEVEFDLVGEGGPILLVAGSKPSFRYLIMPMKS
jgi:DNA polymerase-3 subunit beta